MNLPTTSIILLASLLLMACDNKPASSPNSMASNTSTTVTTDAWLGKWIGPEGTFMEITGGNGIYEITIQDLDGPKQYKGTNKGNQISFERNGTTEIIQTSTGPDTGMKWLADKPDCLRVRPGEGWCRD